MMALDVREVHVCLEFCPLTSNYTEIAASACRRYLGNALFSMPGASLELTTPSVMPRIIVLG
ncbi:MAG: hypothetical protein QOJ51_929 [Acidobacteriaceae bacterium]|jgi:hypothetical protein|nr:hypothetical protein [Acidobacteriaceae bacterium]